MFQFETDYDLQKKGVERKSAFAHKARQAITEHSSKNQEVRHHLQENIVKVTLAIARRESIVVGLHGSEVTLTRLWIQTVNIAHETSCPIPWCPMQLAYIRKYSDSRLG